MSKAPPSWAGSAYAARGHSVTCGNPAKRTTFGGAKTATTVVGRSGFRTMQNALNGRCLCPAVGCQRFPKIESGSVVHGWRLLRWSRRMHVIHRAWILGVVVANHLDFSFYRQTLISCMFVLDISYLHQQAVVRTDWHLQSTYPP